MPTIERLLFPTDFSDQASAALGYAVGLAKTHGAKLDLLHAYTLPLTYSPIEIQAPSDVASAVRDVAARKLLKTLETVQWEKVDAEMHLLEGDPGYSISEFAERRGTDLIVMATHGYTGLKHALLGSVAERTVKSAPCPVLTTKSGRTISKPLRLRKIVVPTDFSASATAALVFGRDLALTAGPARIILVHAYVAPVSLRSRVERARGPGSAQHSHRMLAELEAHARSIAKRGVSVSFNLRPGDPASEIVKVAREEEADLIVMGTRGRTGLAHLLPGSVAERVLRLAPCPVVTVRGSLAGT